MKIAELFHSIQGEGKLTGLPSVFVRCSGCNLRCTWCDTPYASWDPQGQDLSIDQIVARVAEFNTPHVVLTGGEPMIMPGIVDLCAALKQRGHHLTIETAGTVHQPLQADLMSLSPKLSNSTPWERDAGRFARPHEAARLNIPVLQRLIDDAPDFQLKFVIAAPSDLDEMHALLTQLTGWTPADILLMPEGTDQSTLASRTPWLVDLCKQHGYRFCPRLHIALFGNTRGT